MYNVQTCFTQIEDPLNGVCGDPKLYKDEAMAMGFPETPGCANDNLLLKQILFTALRHLALLIARDVTCKHLEGQLNR
jgi:hypothetical protein